jgi:fructose-1,6-bisphosphatase/inositol monophosphatase family enzyme
VTRLEESCLYVELPGKKYRQQNNFTAERVKGLQAVIKLLGSGARVENYRLAWGLSLVANGGFEAYLDFSGTTKPWDICAGIVLVREAGGKIYYQKTQKGFVKVFGTNGKIDKELFNVLK